MALQTTTYREMSDICLCTVPWEFGYADVYLPNYTSHAQRKANMRTVLNNFKANGKSFTGCRPVRNGSFFYLNIPYEDALDYNYVIYTDKDVLFRRGTTTTTETQETTTYDNESGCIVIDFMDTTYLDLEAFGSATVEPYQAYKITSLNKWYYKDINGTLFETSKHYVSQTTRSGGTYFERYAFITDVIRVNDYITGFEISTDLWVQYFVMNGGIHFGTTAQVVRAMSQEPDNIKKWRGVHDIVPERIVQTDKQRLKIWRYEDADGVLHSVTTTGTVNCNTGTAWSHTYDSTALEYGRCMSMVLWVTGHSCLNGLTYENASMDDYLDYELFGGLSHNWVVSGYQANGGAGVSMNGNTCNGLECIWIGHNVKNTTISWILGRYGYQLDGTAQSTYNTEGDQIIQICYVPSIAIHSMVMGGQQDKAMVNDSIEGRGVSVKYEYTSSDWYQGHSAKYKPIWFDNAELVLSDLSGTTQTYKLKDFHGSSMSQVGNPYFYLICDVTPTPSIWCCPMNYNIEYNPLNGDHQSFKSNLNPAYGFCLSQLPMGSWSSDSYGAWVAQNGGLDNMYKSLSLSNSVIDANARSSIANANAQIAQNNIQMQDNRDASNYAKTQASIANTQAGLAYEQEVYSSVANTAFDTAGNLASASGSGNIAGGVASALIGTLGGVANTAITAEYGGQILQGTYASNLNTANRTATSLTNQNRQLASANSALGVQIGAIQQTSNAQQALNALQLQMSITGAKASPDSGCYGQTATLMSNHMFGLWAWVNTPSYLDYEQACMYVDRYGYNYNGKIIYIGNYAEIGGYNTPATYKYSYPFVGRNNVNYVQFNDIRCFNDVNSTQTEYICIPDEYLRTIEEIFKHGVHIWHDLDHMYDYTYNNDPLSTLPDNNTELGDGFCYYSGNRY